jgi:hypothetical protein
MRHSSETRPHSTAGGAAGLLAAGLSFLVPGMGHVVVLGELVRGLIWTAGWFMLVALGAIHLVPGIALMALSAFDAWWISRAPAANRDARPPRPGDGTH